MAFTNPEANIGKLSLKHGEIVVDFGAGTGLYSALAAKRVGGAGRVYTIDIQKDLLINIRDRARAEGITNIETIWGDVEKLHGSKLDDNFADAVIISNMLFQVADKNTVIKEAKRILKPGGRVFLIEWRDSFSHLGPTPDMVLGEGAAKKLCMDEGLHYEDEFELGDHHYGLIFKKDE